MKKLFLYPIALVLYPLVLFIRGIVWVAIELAEIEEEFYSKRKGGGENEN